MHHSTDGKVHTTAFVTPIVEHWLEHPIITSDWRKRREEQKSSVQLYRQHVAHVENHSSSAINQINSMCVHSLSLYT